MGVELDAIAAVAVGGTLLTGGRSTVWGTLVGALTIQIVRYTLLANGVPAAAAMVVNAAITIVAVWLQQRGKRACRGGSPLAVFWPVLAFCWRWCDSVWLAPL